MLQVVCEGLDYEILLVFTPPCPGMATQEYGSGLRRNKGSTDIWRLRLH